MSTSNRNSASSSGPGVGPSLPQRVELIARSLGSSVQSVLSRAGIRPDRWRRLHSVPLSITSDESSGLASALGLEAGFLELPNSHTLTTICLARLGERGLIRDLLPSKLREVSALVVSSPRRFRGQSLTDAEMVDACLDEVGVDLVQETDLPITDRL